MTQKDFLKLRFGDRVEMVEPLPYLPIGTQGNVVEELYSEGVHTFIKVEFTDHPKGEAFHKAVHSFIEMNAGMLGKVKAKKGKDGH